jgi:hypothetical protein
MAVLRTIVSTDSGSLRGKSVSAVKNSRTAYNELLAIFGGIDLMPSSVMRIKRKRPCRETDTPQAERSYLDSSMYADLSREDKKYLDKQVEVAYKLSGRGSLNGALSPFWQDVGRSVVLLYSDPGQRIYDPFAGHNSRMELCVRSGRHYYASDICKEFMAFNRKRAKELKNEFPHVRVKLSLGDSRKVAYKSESCDFTITSPPYWDIEYYGPEHGQLGTNKSYEEFLHGMSDILKENYRILKPGSYAAYFVNDFRRDGKMYFYHVDTMRIAEEAGFISHDIMIVDIGRSMRDCFPNLIVKTKILPKRHEYCLVFRKPEMGDTE